MNTTQEGIEMDMEVRNAYNEARLGMLKRIRTKMVMTGNDAHVDTVDDMIADAEAEVAGTKNE